MKTLNQFYSYLSLILLMLFPVANAMAQQTTTGTVTDAQTGEPLIGVNILVVGTSTGTATDADGHYSLTVSSLQDKLRFSYIGYKTKTVPINGRTTINVAMEPTVMTGEELVVIGFGTQQISDVTGSIAHLDASTFKNRSITQISGMLNGMVGGLNVTQGTSAAGGGTFEIRGRNSLTASSNPMVVVDGAIYNGSLRNINPADIKSIDILKGASAAAIYGSRASNGVIIVTTKKGRKGEPVINMSVKVGSTKAGNINYGVRGPKEYIRFRQAFLRQANPSKPDYYYADPDNLPKGITLKQWRTANPNPLSEDTREWLSRLNFFPPEVKAYLAGHSINWLDKVMRTGLRQNYNLSIRGGTPKTNYYLSAGYVNNDGIIRGDQFSVVRTRLNLVYKVVDWLQIGTHTQFSVRNENAIPASINDMQRVSPFAYMHNDDGSLEWYPGGYIGGQNPLINTLGQEKNRKIIDLFSNLFAEVTLPFGINYKISFQPHFVNRKDYNYWSPLTIMGGRTYDNGFVRRTDFSKYRWRIVNTLKWHRTFGVHEFNVTLMQNVEVGKTWRTRVENSGFSPLPVLGYSGVQYGAHPSINTIDRKYTANALLGRLNYNLLDKYLLTVSLRRDGYSAFGSKHPYAYFPSVALAWKIAKEDFFDVKWLNKLKLRLSWGKNGNRAIGIYSALARIKQVPYYNGENVEGGISITTLSNPGLRWEQTTSFNLGVDVGILQNRANLSVDFYIGNTNQLLVERRLPKITGFDHVTTNLGKIVNRGIELTLNSVNINSNDIKWSSRLVFSLNRNKIKELYGIKGQYTLMGKKHKGEIPDFKNEWFIGRSIDAVWNYDMIGIWQEDEANAAARYGLIPGDIKARDLNNDDNYTELQDKVFLGHTVPRYFIGFRNEINFFGNFTFSILFNAKLGHIRPFPDAIHTYSTYNRRNTQPVSYWTKENKSKEWPRLVQHLGPFGGGVMIYKPASFVRIQNLSLSYRFSSAIVEQFQLKNMRVFLSAQNVAVFTKWPGFDPVTGIEEPMPRIITAGIDITL